MTEPISPPATPEPARRKRAIWPLFLLVVLGLAGAGIAFYFQKQKQRAAALEARRWAPIVMPDRMARVPADWSIKTLGERLQKTNKLRDSKAFEAAAREIGLKTIAPGGYALPKTAGPRDLVKVFKAGPTHGELTFPEGFTGMQIAARLNRNGFIGAKDFNRLVYPARKFSPFEGTLFPATYELPLRANGKLLVDQMQEGFAKQVKALPKPLPKVNGKPLTLAEVVTVASLVEREAASHEEMPLVAGVIINRLNLPMRLQIDAAIIYAYKLANKDKDRLLYSDYKYPSPFNLYTNDGLPPAPICNPGATALKAAAKPAKTDALYYVYSPKLKQHRFARKYSDHLRNVRLGREERAARLQTSNR